MEPETSSEETAKHADNMYMQGVRRTLLQIIETEVEAGKWCLFVQESWGWRCEAQTKINSQRFSDN